MTEPGRTSPPSEHPLNAGMGDRVRREYLLRALAAVFVGAMFAAVAVYGVSGDGDASVPFAVFGVAGVAAQLALAAGFLTARAAITGDRYDKPVVTRVRRAMSAVLAVLVAGVVVGFVAGAAVLGSGLAGLLAGGLIAGFAVTAEGWRRLRYLG